METHIAMLRGINVGGHNQIKMAALRELFENLGFKQCQTYIQSGNVVFQAPKRSALGLVSKIEGEIVKRFGLAVSATIRSAAEMEKVTKTNPFLKTKGIDVTKLHVTFLSQEPERLSLKKLEGLAAAGEDFRGSGREIYLYCPNGYGNTKLNNNALEKVLAVSATTRNWNTVNRLYEMALECGK